MIEFQENTLTDVKREEWRDPISWDPSSYCLGPNKYNCSRLAFKVKDNKYNCSGPYLKVKKKKKKKNKCRLNQKLLHYCQHAENLLNT